MNNITNVLGYWVSTKPVNELVIEALSSSSLTIVNTINPHSYVEAKKDKDFSDALKKSDILVPDGSGIKLAASFLNNVSIDKIAGFDLFSTTMECLNENNGSVFFLGSTDKVLNDIEVKISKDYPNVVVNTLSPPFKAEFDDDDKNDFISKINACSPDVLFVGLTAPKQEKLIYSLQEELNVKMVSGVGAVFDFYSGNVKRPSDIWLKLHLEWLIRFLGEPRRLWRRNFISTPIFLKDLFVNKIKM